MVLPALVRTTGIDVLLDSVNQTRTQEVRTEETTREMDVPYTVQHSGTRKSPLVRPPHMLNFQSGKIWYPSKSEVCSQKFLLIDGPSLLCRDQEIYLYVVDSQSKS